ncbi:hypothetical protein IMSHALPRED_001654 [Imshaugia aleurites]|uniref:Uncharacterized protein n=1 Tax=Imshaugia aleurites TaxID=172621 RepID=A0A8H3J338_9LECA|nr:hypothetical protein IMSHALPRED_001654 [Imshaugia aleurites]
MIANIAALIVPLPAQNLTTPHLHNNSLAAYNPTLTYHVPRTPTVLYINYFPWYQVPRGDLLTAIRNIQKRMADHIEEKGDGWLLPPDDPIIETIRDVEHGNWNIVIQSSPVTVHLTYGVVLEVMDGWETLIGGQVGACQMFAAIQNERRGQLGRLRVFRPGYGDLMTE